MHGLQHAEHLSGRRAVSAEGGLLQKVLQQFPLAGVDHGVDVRAQLRHLRLQQGLCLLEDVVALGRLQKPGVVLGQHLDGLSERRHRLGQLFLFL